jgi:crotonobetainyl-CoA:carnitine CoA-transferase CaiB-like acyl-CoA transferase
MAGPLSHIRVLDLTRVLAGPWAVQNLADLGAEVIKVERPGKGDDSRAYGPPWLKDESGQDTTEAGYFLAANRGKRSITIDIAQKAGADLVRDLAKTADVFMENYKFGDLARYGLGYDDLKQINPKIIYCSITGFGQTGPYRERPGFDFMVQGMGGVMSVTGERDDRAGGGPQRVGIPVIDIMTGMYASIAVCAAIAHRERTGVGQAIDLALLDTSVAFLANQAMNYLVTGEAPGRLGNTHPNIVPYQSVRTKDGNLILACGNDNLFNKFCDAAGAPELKTDPRFAKNSVRVANRGAMDEVLDRIFARHTTEEWVVKLEAAGVPCGPINTIDQVFQNEQVVARNIRQKLEHPTAGSAPTIASPMRFSQTKIEHKLPPPLLGQHTDEVLRTVLGRSEEQIERLKADGIV